MKEYKFYGYVDGELQMGISAETTDDTAAAEFCRQTVNRLFEVKKTNEVLLNVFRTHREGKSCRMPRWAAMSKSAFLLGLFTGINFCPSLLIALS